MQPLFLYLCISPMRLPFVVLHTRHTTAFKSLAASAETMEGAPAMQAPTTADGIMACLLSRSIKRQRSLDLVRLDRSLQEALIFGHLFQTERERVHACVDVAQP
jgi:hypothetical protein